MKKSFVSVLLAGASAFLVLGSWEEVVMIWSIGRKQILTMGQGQVPGMSQNVSRIENPSKPFYALVLYASS